MSSPAIESLVQQLEEARNAYTLLQYSMESLRDILIFSIDRNYRYLNFNRAFREATRQAYGTEVKVGVSMLDTITDENERAKAKRNCDLAISGGAHSTIEMYGNLVPSYFETRYNPIINETQDIIGVTILSSNVTERKAAEDQILSLNRELESFSYSIAHDLQAPLRVISGYTGIIREDHIDTLSEDAIKLFDTISMNVQKMSRQIESLLKFSKLGRAPVTKAKIDVDSMVRSIVNEYKDQTDGPKPKIVLGELKELNGDRDLMEHVFANLISNAIKYSRKKPQPVVEVSSFSNPESVTYAIRDNGAGFDMRNADKLFQVFQRLHRSTDFEGTGVGLAIVHKIISKHNGKISAQGTPGEGATFTFVLPS